MSVFKPLPKKKKKLYRTLPDGRVVSYARWWQLERRKKGLCAYCGARPPRRGEVICRLCRKRRNATNKRWRDEKLAQGLCKRCGQGKILQRGYCAECFAKVKATIRSSRKRRYYQRKAAGLCPYCGARKHSQRCPQRQRYNERRALQRAVLYNIRDQLFGPRKKGRPRAGATS